MSLVDVVGCRLRCAQCFLYFYEFHPRHHVADPPVQDVVPGVKDHRNPSHITGTHRVKLCFSNGDPIENTLGTTDVVGVRKKPTGSGSCVHANECNGVPAPM